MKFGHGDKTAGPERVSGSDGRRDGQDEDVSEESNGPRFLRLSQVSEILRISDSQTYALVRSGDLQGIQIGGRNQWRVERSKLEEYIQQAYRRTAENLERLQADDDDDSGHDDEAG